MFRFLRTQKRIEELEEKVEILEKALKSISLEWNDTYDKFRHLNWRVTKRVAALEGAREEAPVVEGDANGGEASAATTGTSLSPRQIELNNKILSRRRGGQGGLLHG